MTNTIPQIAPKTGAVTAYQRLRRRLTTAAVLLAPTVLVIVETAGHRGP